MGVKNIFWKKRRVSGDANSSKIEILTMDWSSIFCKLRVRVVAVVVKTMMMGGSGSSGSSQAVAAAAAASVAASHRMYVRVGTYKLHMCSGCKSH